MASNCETERSKDTKNIGKPIGESHNAKHWCIMAEFQVFDLCDSQKSRVDVPQNLQCLSYEVYTTNIAKIFRNQNIYFSFGTCTIIHQQLVSKLQGFMRIKTSYMTVIRALNVSCCKCYQLFNIRPTIA